MRLASIVLVLALTGGCASSLPRPPYTPPSPVSWVEVSRPPPPARVEVVPARPSDTAVWLDGEWIWRRSRWAWLSGRWVDSPPGATFTRWAFVRGSDGKLWVAPGEWRDAALVVVAPPSPLALAGVEGGSVVDADGRTETTGPILHERPHDEDAAKSASPPPTAPTP